MTNVPELYFAGALQGFQGDRPVRERRKGGLEIRAVIAITASILTAITASSIILNWLDGNIALVCALLTVVVSVGIVLGKHRDEREFHLFLCDDKGYPRTDVAIESPSGPRYPDDHGKVVASPSWNGLEITIHDAKTWQLLDTQRINNIENKRIVKIILKDKHENKVWQAR